MAWPHPTMAERIVVSQHLSVMFDASPERPLAAIVEIDNVVRDTINGLLGTVVPDDAPLMGAGLDSIAATELVSTLG